VSLPSTAFDGGVAGSYSADNPGDCTGKVLNVDDKGKAIVKWIDGSRNDVNLRDLTLVPKTGDAAVATSTIQHLVLRADGGIEITHDNPRALPSTPFGEDLPFAAKAMAMVPWKDHAEGNVWSIVCRVCKDPEDDGDEDNDGRWLTCWYCEAAQHSGCTSVMSPGIHPEVPDAWVCPGCWADYMALVDTADMIDRIVDGPKGKNPFPFYCHPHNKNKHPLPYPRPADLAFTSPPTRPTCPPPAPKIWELTLTFHAPSHPFPRPQLASTKFHGWAAHLTNSRGSPPQTCPPICYRRS